jgi:hypothetical protein
MPEVLPKQREWRLWQKGLAYAVLIGLSLLAVWYVDLKVHLKPATTIHN